MSFLDDTTVSLDRAPVVGDAGVARVPCRGVSPGTTYYLHR